MLDLEKPQRQSSVGVIVIFFKNLRKAVNFIFYFFVVQFSMNTGMLFLWVAIVVIVLLTLVYSILVYKRFVFYIDEGEFIIEKGLFNREKIAVPFERIQSVHIDQNVVQRALKVVGLKIDTAGSGTKELEIVALPDTFARSIQEYLIEKKNLQTDESQFQEAERDVEGRSEPLKEPIISLKAIDVLKVGLTENHLKTSLALFALINGYYWQSQDFFFTLFQDYITDGEEFILSKWLMVLPLLLLSLLVISIVISVVMAFLKYHHLQFFLGLKEVVNVSGLLKRVEYQIPISKIQYLKYSSNPLRKLFGIKTLVVKQASSIASSDKQSLMIPGCKQAQLDAVIRNFFPELRQTSLTFKANPYLKIQMVLFFSLLPSIFIGFLSLLNINFLFLAILVLMVSLPLSLKYAANMRLALTSEVMQLHKGWIFPKTEILKHYKLQSVAIKQNVFQKRRNTAHLDFYTAAGSLRMWQLDADVADELYNYLLYKIESSNEKWM
ncbi:MAG: putative membrane protein [Vicingaceae bacterium]|jgi:putative membrane protein